MNNYIKLLIAAVTLGITFGLIPTLNYLDIPDIQTAQAILCPVDDISTHAENIFENIHNYKYDEAKAEAQKLINLVDKLEQDKIDEDNSGFSMYN